MAENPLVGMVMATMLEATSMIEKASLAKIADQPFPLYQGEDLVLVISGVGKANAAMATTYCCLKYSPFWICNLGAAGATDYLYQPGEIYHIVKVIEYDRPHLRSDSPRIHLPYILPGFKTATLATQDRPVMDQEARKELAPLADLVDMEAAAVIQACRKFATPCAIFKFVSDTPAHSRHDEIVAHIKYYRSLLSDFCSKSVIPALKKIAASLISATQHHHFIIQAVAQKVQAKKPCQQILRGVFPPLTLTLSLQGRGNQWVLFFGVF